MLASLPMYERPETRASHDRFWELLKEAMQRRGISAPDRLSRPSDDLLDHWRRPDLLFSQTCGHPFRTGLCDLVHLVGTPDYGVAGCPPGHYRSILIRRASDGRTRLADFDGATLAYNDPLSQSGHIAPAHHARREGIRLDPAVRTGSHRLSVQAVAEGRADVAAIDAVTWSILEQWEAGLDQVRPFAETDPTPGLPYITALGNAAPALHDAAEDAIAGLSDHDRRILRLRGLVRVEPERYHAMLR